MAEAEPARASVMSAIVDFICVWCEGLRARAGAGWGGRERERERAGGGGGGGEGGG